MKKPSPEEVALQIQLESSRETPRSAGSAAPRGQPSSGPDPACHESGAPPRGRAQNRGRPDLPRQAAAGGEAQLDGKLRARGGIEWGTHPRGIGSGRREFGRSGGHERPRNREIFGPPNFYFSGGWGGGGTSKKRSFFSQSLQNFAIHNGNVVRDREGSCSCCSSRSRKRVGQVMCVCVL